MGFEGEGVRVGGTPFRHALGMHPGWGATAFAEYALPPRNPRTPLPGGKALLLLLLLRTEFGINDSASPHTRKLVFSLAGRRAAGGSEWVEVWTSRPVVKGGQVHKMPPQDVSRFASVRLRVRAVQSNACAHAVFLNPRIVTSSAS